jgi:antitoxin VapB
VALNIKNPKTCELIQQLASLTGESLTQAVTEAVRERLERIQQGDRSKDGLAELLLAIGRDAAQYWKEPYRSTPHGDLLYDERGLPK